MNYLIILLATISFNYKTNKSKVVSENTVSSAALYLKCGKTTMIRLLKNSRLVFI
jgi:hypothetical protein